MTYTIEFKDGEKMKLTRITPSELQEIITCTLKRLGECKFKITQE